MVKNRPKFLFLYFNKFLPEVFLLDFVKPRPFGPPLEPLILVNVEPGLEMIPFLSFSFSGANPKEFKMLYFCLQISFIVIRSLLIAFRCTAACLFYWG